MSSVLEELSADTPRQPQLPRSQSSPVENTNKEEVHVLGRPYRTPSPRRDSILHDVTPKAQSYFQSITSPDVPATPRRSSQFNIFTPTAKPGYAAAHGLLTPNTPGFDRNAIATPNFRRTGADVGVDDDTSSELKAVVLRNSSRTESDITFVGDDDSEDDEPLQTHFDKLQQQIRDAELAAKAAHEEGTSRTRRSTRIATKDTKVSTQIVPVPVKSTKAAKDVRPSSPAAPSETSLSTEAVVQLPPDINPALLTLDWQLQYPPGGSTHPSYAYPQMDPRLFFSPSTVPIVDGLPTVLALPPLVLPMGWRQVSWAGFLPIVFDPYHQGFKLTPIGPLPLTCEEVQQGGLAKFVPGGECHPEAGLLPDATPYSDGSDEEKYSFEGVDWVLPWPQGETFDGLTTSAPEQSGSDTTASADGMSSHRKVAPGFYVEGRDCPDGIVDLEDAWRWLKEKEVNPAADFKPSPDKTWRGSGIHKVTRKLKVPIASLMGAAIIDTLVNTGDPYASFLINQNGRGFCHFKSVATPVDVNVTLLKDVEITIVELLSYFPNVYLWRKAADRLIRAGFGAAEIANFINWSRGLECESAKVINSIYDQIYFETQHVDFGVRKKLRIVREQKDDDLASYTTEGWTFQADWVTTDYPLLALPHGLQHVPKGSDAGPLTAVIQWCREQGRYDKLLSDVPALLEEANYQPLIEVGDTNDPDKEVLSRYVNKLRKDRRRVLQASKEKKRLAEEGNDEEEGRKKKRTKRE